MLYNRPKSKFYWCRFTAPNGIEIRRSTKTINKKEAQEYEARLTNELWRVHRLGDKPKRYWQEAVIRFLAETSNKATHENDKSYLRFASSFLKDKRLDEINRDMLDTISDAKKATGVANATVNRMMEIVRAVLNKAVKEWEWIDKAPAIRMLPEPLKRIRWLTRVEADRLLYELPKHTRVATEFSLATGLRESNVVNLEWSQIDLARKVAWVHADQAKGKKAIGIPLNVDAVNVIKKQIGRHNTRVFTYNGTPITKFNTQAWRKALKRAGIENFRWHDLRHTWASWHVQNGTPLHVLQELGGWSDIKMVMQYAHLAPEHLAKYADNISHSDAVCRPIRTLSGTPENGHKKQRPDNLITA